MIQKVFYLLGKDGCYFLSICELARKLRGGPVDIVATYWLAIERGWMDERCYMLKPEKLLGHLTSRVFVVTKKPADYVTHPDEYEVTRYEYKNGMETLAHFVLPDYDPYGDSITRKKGFVASKRIFRQVHQQGGGAVE